MATKRNRQPAFTDAAQTLVERGQLSAALIHYGTLIARQQDSEYGLTVETYALCGRLHQLTIDVRTSHVIAQTLPLRDVRSAA